MMHLTSWNLADKQVLVRADLNTDLHTIERSLKFQRLLPTLQYIKDQGARTLLLTHLGRPHRFQAALSTQPLVSLFEKHGFRKNTDIVVHENVRFNPQEDTQSLDFAQQLAHGCDFFVEDGFGVLAREETSVVTVAQLFKPAYRSIGFLVQQELEHLQPIKDHAEKPYLVMVGGGKAQEKLTTLYNFLDKATHIALCPALSDTSTSSVLKTVNELKQAADKRGVTLLLPHDYLYDKATIGLETVAAWLPIIQSAHTIVYNGLMGYPDRSETTTVTRQLFETFMTLPHTQVIIAGGDTTLAAQDWNIDGKNIFLSTGGGATLTYLAGQNLPGLTVLD